MWGLVIAMRRNSRLCSYLDYFSNGLFSLIRPNLHFNKFNLTTTTFHNVCHASTVKKQKRIWGRHRPRIYFDSSTSLQPYWSLRSDPNKNALLVINRAQLRITYMTSLGKRKCNSRPGPQHTALETCVDLKLEVFCVSDFTLQSENAFSANKTHPKK